MDGYVSVFVSSLCSLYIMRNILEVLVTSSLLVERLVIHDQYAPWYALSHEP